MKAGGALELRTDQCRERQTGLQAKVRSSSAGGGEHHICDNYF